MKIKQFLSLTLAAVLSAVMMASCGGSTAAPSAPSASSNLADVKAVVNIAMLTGPSGIGAAKLLDNAYNGNALNDYKYTVATSIDEITPKLLNDTFDIAAVPSNVAAMLYNNSGGKVKMIAINTLGVLYVLEKGNTVTDFASLKGKTVYISGEGTTTEYAVRALLTDNNIDPDRDVKLKFVDGHAKLAEIAASGEVDICVLPEPYVTDVLLKNTVMRLALDVNALWRSVYGDDAALPMGCVVARTGFIEKNPDAVEMFLTEYKQSVEFVNGNVDAAAELCAKYGLLDSAAVGKAAIARCSAVFISGNGMQSTAEPYFSILNKYSAKSIGGRLPDEAFYYYN